MAEAPPPAPPTGPPARKPALPALSGLRTILAVNVMFFHFTPPHPAFLSPVIDNAYVFVGFFFLISGFVLGYNYGDRPSLSKKTFYVARASRVYPVYLLVLLLSLPFLPMEWHSHTHWDFYKGLLLTPLALQAWVPSLATFWNTVGWTVPAEFLLYALFPFLLLLFAGRRWLATPQRVVVAILIVWLLGLVPHSIYFALNPDHLPGPANRFTYATWLRVLKYNPMAYICTFSAGVLLAKLHGMLELTPRQRTWVAVAALTGLGLFFGFGVERIPYVIVHGSLLLPVFSALLIGLSGSNPVAAVLSWRPLMLFGETTLALYLLHFNAILMLSYYKVPQKLHVERFDPWITFAFVMVMAVLVLKFYERPARQAFLRLFGQATTNPKARHG